MKAVGPRFAIAAAALVVSLGAAACGSDDAEGERSSSAASSAESRDEKGIRATLVRTSQAMQARDFAAVCRLATSEVRKKAKEWEGYPTCAKGMRDAMTDDPTGKLAVASIDMPEITQVDISGASATVSAKRGRKPLFARLKKESGAWHLERWFSED